MCACATYMTATKILAKQFKVHGSTIFIYYIFFFFFFLNNVNHMRERESSKREDAPVHLCSAVLIWEHEGE